MENPLKGLEGKNKKVLVGVGVIAAGYVVWRWSQSRSTEETVTVTSGMDAEQPGTGVIGSNVGGSENVGNFSNVSTSETISSNDKWFSEAVDRLSNSGWEPRAVQSALGEFLTGQALDSDEVRIVRAAVGAMGGYPPAGPMTVKETVGVTDVSKLPAPTGLKAASKTSTTVDLTFNPVSGAKQYRAYRSGASQNVGGSADTKIRVAGLEPGKSYTFYVAAGLDGGKMGPRSSGVTVKTESKKLSAPTGVKVSSVGKSSAKITWNPTYPNEYMIRRSGSSSTWESVDTHFTATGLKPRTKYSYQIAAVQPGTRTPGPWSSYVTFTTKR